MALKKIGKYEKLDVLGHGASGIVYLAWDILLGKHVALKEISLQAADEARFLDEARVLDRLCHPNIVRVNGVDKVDGRLIIDMEYVKGTNLHEYMRRHGKLPVREALSIAVQVTDALDFAHRNHTVHRDVKPANILMSRDGEAKIVDFGLAEILGSGSYAGGAGTYAYMAPEDFAEEERSDHRSDIWSAGVTIYEMLSGKRPFQPVKMKDPFSWKRAVEEDEPPPLSEIDSSVSSEVEQVIAKALAKNKNERYQSIGEMRDRLQDLLTSLGGPVRLSGQMGQSEAVESTVLRTPTRSPVADMPAEAAPDWITVDPRPVDFGKVRKGESSEEKLMIRVPGRGRVAGRVVSQPGWLSVSPQAFSRRKQALTLLAETESIWKPGVYKEHLHLEVDGERIPVPVSMSVLQPRRQFDEAAWWYLPLLGLCVAPLAARMLSGGDDTLVPALVIAGLLSIMLFIISVVADLGILEKLIPAAIGAVGLGAVVGAIVEVSSGGQMPNMGTVFMISVLGTPLCLLIVVQLLTASKWRVWAVVLALVSICAAVVMVR